MNRFILPGVVLLLLVIMGAGSASAEPPSIGIQGGVNLSKFVGQDASDSNERKLGFQGGVFLEYDLIGILSFQPELMFITKGSKVSGTKYNISYIEIPLLFKFHIPSAGVMKPNVYAGPYGALKITESIDSSDSSVWWGLDYGITLGGGVDIGKLLLTARYDWGLANIPDMTDVKVQNSTIMVMAGFRIR